MPPRYDFGQRLLPSLLDRLKGVGEDSGQELRSFMACVKQDLQDLLNARWQAGDDLAEYPHLNASLICYGLPDFSTVGMQDDTVAAVLARAVEAAIRNFEPRLTDARVTLISDPEPHDRQLCFRIEAMLTVESIAEPVVFSSELEPATQAFSVRTAERA